MRLTRQQDKITVEVTGDGRGLTSQPDEKPSGHGLIGIRERVAMYGGEFSAGPLPAGGFRVTAAFPLTLATAVA